MDKNFVNIDNLVRQRLGGGEEPERSGSWQNMRELLDKEMPQEKPVGFLYWRTVLSSVAVLLLIGTLGVGGYKIASSLKDNNAVNNNSGTVAMSSAASTAAMPGSIAGAAKNDEANRQITTSGVEDKDQPVSDSNNTHGKKAIAANDNRETNNRTGANKDAHKNIAAAIVNEKPAKRKAAVTANNKTAIASANTKNNSKQGTPVFNAANNTPAVASTGGGGHVGNGRKTTGSKAIKADDKTNTLATAAGANKNTQHPGSIAVLNSGAPVTNNNSVANDKKDAAASGLNKMQTAGANKIVTGDNNPVVKNIAGINAGSVIGAGNNSGKDSKTATANSVADTKNAVDAGKTAKTENMAPRVPVFVTKSGNRISGDKLQRLNLDRASKAKNNDHPVSVEPLKGKKVIQKMALYQHLVKSATGESSYKMDTVSMVTLTEELGIVTETKTIVPPSSKTSGGGSSTTNNKAIADPTVLSASASAKSHSANNETNAPAKMGNGAQTIENLTAAFNDVKYHVAGIQFAPGLTAGINGTFFGPNSFKGFQFGFAGNFIVSDKVGLMTEFKYFHRINNNYEVNDNYYTYTPVSGGYSKELQLNSYSFSTLHSFELPVAIRYTEQKFSFFAGANFEYSFAINTGAASQSDPNNITMANTIGNDNAPKLKEQDFNSRFGIGYLFGVSYKVSPNVNLDIRNVQTVWDNSRSQGARDVSSQLYRSPSFQLSFGYRLGGNRTKE